MCSKSSHVAESEEKKLLVKAQELDKKVVWKRYCCSNQNIRKCSFIVSVTTSPNKLNDVFSSPTESYVQTLKFAEKKPRDKICARWWIQLKGTVLEVWNKSMQVRLEKDQHKTSRILFFTELQILLTSLVI